LQENRDIANLSSACEDVLSPVSDLSTQCKNLSVQSMSNLDATSLGTLAVRLNLLSEEQLRDAWDELDTPTPEQLVRLLERKGILSAFQGAKILKGDTDGYFLGGYRILYRIAAGSFGRVYRADDPRTGTIVAVKVLRRRWMEDPHKVELFEREGKVGLTLKHPNIVQILAVNRDPLTGQYFIVMEFVEGGNLRDFMTIRKKLDVKEGLRILEESASGLAYAVSKGLTHRDIKLTNILISSSGTSKLVDFGLAELTGDSTDDDDATVDRTVDYAGLEKATGVKLGDPRSDIYFLGCVFYELVTGRPLLEATKDRYQRMARGRFDCSAQLRSATGELPPLVISLLERMTSFEPSQRFQSPAAMVEAVRTVQRDVTGEGHKSNAPTGPKTIFVVEANSKLQDVFREKFRDLGYRVLISLDAGRAVQRYQQQPFHAVIVDAGTVFEEGLTAFENVMKEAEMLGLSLAGILILNDDQASWTSRVRKRDNVAVLVRPVTMKQLATKVNELVPQEPNDE